MFGISSSNFARKSRSSKCNDKTLEQSKLHNILRTKQHVVSILYVVMAIALSCGIAFHFYQSNLRTFQDQKATEKTTALRLVDSFVTNYSSLRSKWGPDAPVPATFRAHAIDMFNSGARAKGRLELQWVGRKGRSISRPPLDEKMARAIEAFVPRADSTPKTEFTKVNGEPFLRSIFPSRAHKISCVSCHNRVQPSIVPWKLNDVMGAFVIDVPMTAFISANRQQSLLVGISVFIVLVGIGYAFLLYHAHQLRHRDIAAEKLEVQNARFGAALGNMGEGLCMFDAEDRLVVHNDQFANFYRLPGNLLTIGTPHRDIITHLVSHGVLKGGTDKKAIEEKVLALSDLPNERTVARVEKLADGRSIRVTRQRMSEGGWVATHEDVTEQIRNQAKMLHMAHHDSLTGLPNRLLFGERLEQSLARIGRGEIAAVHLLDLDQFKHVNDTLGHPIGDKLLQEVTGRLQSQVRETDTVARMGGDEFAVIQVSMDGAHDAKTMAERLIALISEPYDIDGHQVIIGTSIGIAVGPYDGIDTDSLIRNADLALYRAKQDGRNTYTFFESEMNAQMQERRTLENDLRKAIDQNDFELYYQPVANLQSKKLSGFEALLRWNHSEKGLVPPNEFIPLAEETEFIIPIGEWVIQEACATAASWPQHLQIALNLSAVQFRNEGLVETIASALKSTGLSAHRLELEITESILLVDNSKTLDILQKLHELGVRIAMDDFGTGFSSLSYLQSFPFDKIKIDKSFIDNVTDRGDSLSIVRAVVTMARDMNMTTTVEGIETLEQYDLVQKEGCTEMQGYYLSRPLPIGQINERFIRREWEEAIYDEDPQCWRKKLAKLRA